MIVLFTRRRLHGSPMVGDRAVTYVRRLVVHSLRVGAVLSGGVSACWNPPNPGWFFVDIDTVANRFRDCASGAVHAHAVRGCVVCLLGWPDRWSACRSVATAAGVSLPRVADGMAG